MRQYEIKTLKLPCGTLEALKLLSANDSTGTVDYLYEFMVTHLKERAAATKNRVIIGQINKFLKGRPKQVNLLKELTD